MSNRYIDNETGEFVLRGFLEGLDASNSDEFHGDNSTINNKTNFLKELEGSGKDAQELFTEAIKMAFERIIARKKR